MKITTEKYYSFHFENLSFNKSKSGLLLNHQPTMQTATVLWVLFRIYRDNKYTLQLLKLVLKKVLTNSLLQLIVVLIFKYSQLIF
ncbi:MAG: hypothetical protein L3J54_13240, partial [Draconibacterium sp.]|nr:hypothetical protein [Draconibacterium sp.]